MLASVKKTKCQLISDNIPTLFYDKNNEKVCLR